MKLSEAIRLGAMDRGQSIGMVSKTGGVCAIGAALHANGRLIEPHCEDNYHRAFELWPQLKVAQVSPVDGTTDAMIWVITALNDSYEWTREQIADWVETIERAQETAAPVIEQQQPTGTPV